NTNGEYNESGFNYDGGYRYNPKKEVENKLKKKAENMALVPINDINKTYPLKPLSIKEIVQSRTYKNEVPIMRVYEV
ncbi:MAG: hypothetical protein AABY22_11855, partial [Nanoarchaeota archaeon]